MLDQMAQLEVAGGRGSVRISPRPLTAVGRMSRHGNSHRREENGGCERAPWRRPVQGESHPQLEPVHSKRPAAPVNGRGALTQ